MSGGHLLKSEKVAEGGAAGIFVALLFMLGAAFAIGLPRIAAACLAVAGLLGLAAGNSTNFGDLSIWGGVAIALAVMAWFGSRELRRKAISSSPDAAAIGASNLASGAPKNEIDLTSQLERIAKLRSEGSISEAEFETLKSRLMS